MTETNGEFKSSTIARLDRTALSLILGGKSAEADLRAYLATDAGRTALAAAPATAGPLTVDDAVAALLEETRTFKETK